MPRTNDSTSGRKVGASLMIVLLSKYYDILPNKYNSAGKSYSYTTHSRLKSEKKPQSGGGPKGPRRVQWSNEVGKNRMTEYQSFGIFYQTE